MASGTTGTMRSTPASGGYLADLLAAWLGRGGGGADAGQPRSLFPSSLGYGQGQAGNAAGPMAPSPATQGVPGIGLQGPNASFWDDYGATGAMPLFPQSQHTTYGRGSENYTQAPSVRQNVPRMGVGAAGVPGVNPGVPGTRAAPGYGGAGDVLAQILGGGYGGRY